RDPPGEALGAHAEAREVLRPRSDHAPFHLALRDGGRGDRGGAGGCPGGKRFLEDGTAIHRCNLLGAKKIRRLAARAIVASRSLRRLRIVNSRRTGRSMRTSHEAVRDRRLGQRLRAGGSSVQAPSKSSAARPMVSPSVGWGWIVLPISVASAPISMASAISPIMSPAWVPTIAPPMIRWVASSKTSLVKPSAR